MAVLACLCVGLSGCASMRKLPVVGKLIKPPYYPYFNNEHFLCEYPRKWGDPSPIKGGVEIRSPDGHAVFSIVYLQPGTEGYQPLERYKRDMAAWGAVEDSHLVETVSLSTATAYQVRFTSYEYDPEYLLGEKVQVSYNEVIVSADPQGLFVVRYRAAIRDFWKRRYRKHYEYFLRNLMLSAPPKD